MLNLGHKSRRPPVSNAERQRRFRERNPGYYQRLHARRRARLEAFSGLKVLVGDADVAATLALQDQTAETVVHCLPAVVPAAVLALPAPAEALVPLPLFSDRATIPTREELAAERETVELVVR
ncbi:MAG: hypothetical protein QM754_09215 [Tepidisphaeraceae bacterium]